MIEKSNAILKKEGKLFILSAPSGTGKTSLSRRLLSDLPNLELSISATTRDPRVGEEDGIHYYFSSEENFKKTLEEGGFLEWAHVFGKNYYGTPKAQVEEKIKKGINILFDIDWQGYVQIQKALAKNTVGIFITPPSLKELEQRLKKRGQDSEETIAHRLKIAKEEMEQRHLYPHVIVNKDFEICLENIKKIIRQETQ